MFCRSPGSSSRLKMNSAFTKDASGPSCKYFRGRASPLSDHESVARELQTIQRIEDRPHAAIGALQHGYVIGSRTVVQYIGACPRALVESGTLKGPMRRAVGDLQKEWLPI